jgi:DNA-binding XRE family transcriptional regulator
MSEKGQLLRKLRTEAGMSQQVVGQLVGRDGRTIGAYERGIFEPPADIKHKLAILFDHCIWDNDELFEDAAQVSCDTRELDLLGDLTLDLRRRQTMLQYLLYAQVFAFVVLVVWLVL